MPELSEPEVVRHFTRLSMLNYAVDRGLYPLGSCTMKYNPKMNEWAAACPASPGPILTPPDALAQGSLELIHELEELLAEITGHGRGHAAARGGSARRADRHHADPRLPRVARRARAR